MISPKPEQIQTEQINNLKGYIMKTIKVNKPTKEGFHALQICMCEFTQSTCYLRPEMYSDNTFIENFWDLRNEVKKMVSEGKICMPMFCTSKNKEVPCIYNSLVF